MKPEDASTRPSQSAIHTYALHPSQAHDKQHTYLLDVVTTGDDKILNSGTTFRKAASKALRIRMQRLLRHVPPNYLLLPISTSSVTARFILCAMASQCIGRVTQKLPMSGVIRVHVSGCTLPKRMLQVYGWSSLNPSAPWTWRRGKAKDIQVTLERVHIEEFQKMKDGCANTEATNAKRRARRRRKHRARRRRKHRVRCMPKYRARRRREHRVQFMRKHRNRNEANGDKRQRTSSEP